MALSWPRVKLCPRCGVGFEVASRSEKYCPPCRLLAEKEHRNAWNATHGPGGNCDNCGAPLSGRQRRFCSPECQLDYLQHDPEVRQLAAATLSERIQAGELDWPPPMAPEVRERWQEKLRTAGAKWARYPVPLREAIRHLRAGGTVATMTEEQRQIYRQWQTWRRNNRKRRQREEEERRTMADRVEIVDMVEVPPPLYMDDPLAVELAVALLRLGPGKATRIRAESKAACTKLHQRLRNSKYVREQAKVQGWTLRTRLAQEGEAWTLYAWRENGRAGDR